MRSGDRNFSERAALLDHLKNENRLRVLEELRKGEVKVTELVRTLKMSQSMRAAVQKSATVAA
ncbi:ArsR family transcriptional regulator [Rhizobium sp. HT1-10]|uniref:ArsR family transcriptional regulator n=1 Tax=Rhizobium sp. HT1-10 TaxID=3111638 RepID=UPI003C1AF6C2